jgi:hypothetical protein
MRLKHVVDSIGGWARAQWTRENWYLRFGTVLGAIVAVATFIGCWINAVGAYGFLPGVGLGWFPSLIIAAIIFALVKSLWAPMLALMGLVGFLYVV